jgi:hypothetical protein
MRVDRRNATRLSDYPSLSDGQPSSAFRSRGGRTLLERG